MPGKSFTIITSVFELEESRYVAENLPLAATPGHSALSGGPRESHVDLDWSGQDSTSLEGPGPS